MQIDEKQEKKRECELKQNKEMLEKELENALELQRIALKLEKEDEAAIKVEKEMKKALEDLEQLQC